MATIQPSADYSDRDLASIRPRFASLIRSVLPSWTDSQIANFGNILKDLYAWSADIQSFALDGQAAEAFLPTATQRASLLKLAAITGYKPAGAAAASTVETFTGVGLSANVPIPAGTTITNLDPDHPIEFQTLSPLTLTPAAPTAQVAVSHSKLVTETFPAMGAPDFTIQLTETPYLPGTLSLSTSVQGQFAEEIGNSFVTSGPSDQTYVAKVDDNDRATVVFGDGVAGAIPLGIITASYRIGGGFRGNVAAHSLQALATPLLDIHGAAANVTVDNVNAATGGADREGTESIRRGIPTRVTTRGMSIARKDYEVHAREIPGVDRILALTSNEDWDVPLNTVQLYGVFAGAPNFPALDAIRRQFVSSDTPPWPCPASTEVGVYVAPLVDIDVTCTVYLRPRAVPTIVDAEIRSALQALFALKVTNPDGSSGDNPLIDFAYYLRVQSNALSPVGLFAASDIENAIRDVPGIREVGPPPQHLQIGATRWVWDYVTAHAFVSSWSIAPARQDINLEHLTGVSGPPAAANFPRLGTVTLVNGDTGAPL
jgi:hypothetical protein